VEEVVGRNCRLLQGPGSDAETVVENVVAACLPEPLRDDVALLAVRLTS